MPAAAVEEFDAIIVGSGAGGGTAAYVLTRAGLKCLMLEAGGWFDTARDSAMLAWNYDAPLLGAPTQGRPYYEASHGGWRLDGEPYSNGTGSGFTWFRSRMLGGRTNHWGRIWLRMGTYDFKPSLWDGKGQDWPISYRELAPYYQKAEELIGVYGALQDRENAPAGHFQPAPTPRCYEHYVKKVCEPMGIPVVPISRAVITQSLNDRPACHYCGQCNRGCSTGSNYSSPTVLLPPALKTGNLTIRCDAMVREILTNKAGLATGVSYIDKNTRREMQVRAKVVVVAGGSCESARLLLNSKSAQYPHGIGNANGFVGKNLMDTVCQVTRAQIPALMNLPPHNCDGAGGYHSYIPWWQYADQKKGKLDFTRGYQTVFGTSRRMPEPISAADGVSRMLGGYGAELKKKYREYFGSTVFFASGGDMLPNEKSYVEINDSVLDEWGIPTLRFHFQWGDEELKQAAHAEKTYADIVAGMGGTVLQTQTSSNADTAAFRGGAMHHEVGTVRMGSHEKNSALNAHCAAWDCRNVFVVDAAPFVGISYKNPTATITALSWRTSDHIISQLKQRSL